MRNENTYIQMILLISVVMAYASQSKATNGVVEINHICATQTGCFSGDTAGFPVTIDGSVGKSYRLTSDLIVEDDATTEAIFIDDFYISIDLNGFSIIRRGCLTSNPSNCISPVTVTGQKGIVSGSILKQAISIKNGNIIGMSEHGIDLMGEESSVINVRILYSKRVGISLGAPNGLISNVVVQGAGLSAILLGDNSTVQNSILRDNVRGISASSSDRMKIINNSIFNNVAFGISLGDFVFIKNNLVYGNGIDGINIGSVARVINNTIVNNTRNGIQVDSNSKIDGNNISGNQNFGINFTGSNNSYKNNTITDNTGGTVNGGFNMSGNFCNTDDVCP